MTLPPPLFRHDRAVIPLGLLPAHETAAPETARASLSSLYLSTGQGLSGKDVHSPPSFVSIVLDSPHLEDLAPSPGPFYSSFPPSNKIAGAEYRRPL